MRKYPFLKPGLKKRIIPHRARVEICRFMITVELTLEI